MSKPRGSTAPPTDVLPPTLGSVWFERNAAVKTKENISVRQATDRPALGHKPWPGHRLRGNRKMYRWKKKGKEKEKSFAKTAADGNTFLGSTITLQTDRRGIKALKAISRRPPATSFDADPLFVSNRLLLKTSRWLSAVAPEDYTAASRDFFFFAGSIIDSVEVAEC